MIKTMSDLTPGDVNLGLGLSAEITEFGKLEIRFDDYYGGCVLTFTPEQTQDLFRFLADCGCKTE